MTGHEPYLDLSDEEVEERYRKRQFPVVDIVTAAEMVRKCWTEPYASANDLSKDLAGLDVSTISKAFTTRALSEILDT